MRNIISLAAGAAVFAMSATGTWAQPAEPAPTPATEEVAPEAVAQEAAPVAQAPAEPSAEPAQPAAAAPTGPSVFHVTRSQPPSFVMSTAGKAAFAVVGAIGMIAEGKKIAEAYRLEEPANGLGSDLAAAFAASKQGHVSATIALPEGDKKAIQAVVKEAQGNADYFVHVSPVTLNAIYFSFDWAHYGLIFGTNAQVFDKQDKVIAKAKCFLKPEKTEASPTKDELLANDAARLKEMISEAQAACLTQLKAGLNL